MMRWMQGLHADPIPWLLESDDAALRYRVLVDLLGRPPHHREVRAARAGIPASPVVAAILAAQKPAGHWAEAKSTYWPKYTATHWQLYLLAEFGLSPRHPAVPLGLKSMAESLAAIGAPDAVAQKEVVWCYTGLVLRYYALFGRGATAVVVSAAERLVELAEREPHWACPYNDGRTCLWGAVKALRGLVAMTVRPAGAAEVIDSAARHLLAHDYGPSIPCASTENGWETDWRRFGFPSFYESDLLEALDALAEAGYGRDPAYARLTEIVLQKQDSQGRWILENSLNGRMHADVEVKGEPSRWLTLRALRVLKARVL